MKISDVLWLAANENLWDGVRNYSACNAFGEGFRYSCDAIDQLKFAPLWCTWNLWEDCNAALSFLREELGFDKGYSLRAFDEFPEGPESQGARYSWLMFAHQIALEQGK